MGIARTTVAKAVEIDTWTKGRPELAAAAGVRLKAYLAKHAGPTPPVALVARALAIAQPEGVAVRLSRRSA